MKDITRETSLKEIALLVCSQLKRDGISDFFVEFPSPPVAVGNKPLKRFNEIETKSGYLKLLTPTQCVMDRLAAYYYWNDRQSLEQAILVAKNHEIDFDEIEMWSDEEGMKGKYDEFKKRCP